MDVDPGIVGQSWGPERVVVEAGAIRRFAQAIGDEEPRHLLGEVAPPTFPTTFRTSIPGLDLEKRRILHAGESYRYERGLRAGDVLFVTRRVAEVYRKQGSLGPMTFIVMGAAARDADGALVYESRTTLIYR